MACGEVWNGRIRLGAIVCEVAGQARNDMWLQHLDFSEAAFAHLENVGTARQQF